MHTEGFTHAQNNMCIKHCTYIYKLLSMRGTSLCVCVGLNHWPVGPFPLPLFMCTENMADVLKTHCVSQACPALSLFSLLEKKKKTQTASGLPSCRYVCLYNWPFQTLASGKCDWPKRTHSKRFVNGHPMFCTHVFWACMNPPICIHSFSDSSSSIIFLHDIQEAHDIFVYCCSAFTQKTVCTFTHGFNIMWSHNGLEMMHHICNLWCIQLINETLKHTI